MWQKGKLSSPELFLRLALDSGLTIGALYVAIFLRFGGHPLAESTMPFSAIMPSLWVVTPAVFFSFGVYSGRQRSLAQHLQTLVTGVVTVGVLILVLSFWHRQFSFPRSVSVIALLIQVPLLSLWHAVLWRLDLHRSGGRELLVCGDPQDLPEILKKVSALPYGWLSVRAVVSPDEALQPGFIANIGVNALLLASSLSIADRTRLAVAAFEHQISVYILPEVYDLLVHGAVFDQVDDLPVLLVNAVGLTAVQQAVKRGIDLLLSALGLVVALPVMLFVATLVKLTSRGPVLYQQQRVGQGKRVFTLYKFRTMVADAERFTGPTLARASDPRITKVGWFLRSTRLDELPQLWNILRGDMSLVGPRPERPFFVDQILEEFPDYQYRLVVPPGLTGLAQVSGRYSTDAVSKLKYDLFYIRNYSLSLDAQILALTVRAVFTRDSARGLDEDEDVGDLVQEILTRSEMETSAYREYLK